MTINFSRNSWGKKGTSFLSSGTSLSAQIAALPLDEVFFLGDATDLTSIFIDSAGTTPVTAHDDPVGLVLDKSQMGDKTAAQFIADQPEMTTEGNYADGSSAGGEIIISGASVSLVNTTGTARANHAIGVYEEGKTYRLECDVSGQACSSYHAGSESIGTLAVGHVSITFVATAGSDVVSFRNFAAGTSVVSNISLKEIPGQHLTQPNTAQRPLYQADGSLLFDGVDDNIGFEFAGGAGPSDCSVFMAVKTTDNQAALISYSGGKFAAVAQDSNSGSPAQSSGSPSHHVDGGVDLTTRDGLQTAISDDSYHLLEVRNLDTSNWISMFLGGGIGGYQLGGSFGPRFAITTTAIADANRSLIEQWMRDYKTIEQLVAGQPELWNASLVTTSGESEDLGTGRYRIYSSSGDFSNAQIDETDEPAIVDDEYYYSVFTIESIVSGSVKCSNGGTDRTAIGTYAEIIQASSGKLEFKRSGTTDAVINSCSIKKIPLIT